MTARTTGSRATVIEMRLRPGITAVAITAGVTARQVIDRFGAGGDGAADHVATFAELGRLLEYAFDVAGFTLRLLMYPGQRKAGFVVIEARLALGGGIARTDQRHAQQCDADEQQ